MLQTFNRFVVGEHGGEHEYDDRLMIEEEDEFEDDAFIVLTSSFFLFRGYGTTEGGPLVPRFLRGARFAVGSSLGDSGTAVANVAGGGWGDSDCADGSGVPAGVDSHFLAFRAESAAAVSASFLLEPSPEPSSIPSQRTFATNCF